MVIGQSCCGLVKSILGPDSFIYSTGSTSSVVGNGVVYRANPDTGTSSVFATGLSNPGGIAPQQKSNSITRAFTFSGLGGIQDPQIVGLEGVLDGLLHADLGGSASVQASILLADASGNAIVSDSISIPVSATLGQTVEVDVFEKLQVSALLTPGTTYRLTSSLDIAASGGALGRGFADFRNTFEVNLTGAPVPEPGTLFLLALGLAGLARHGRRGH